MVRVWDSNAVKLGEEPGDPPTDGNLAARSRLHGSGKLRGSSSYYVVFVGGVAWFSGASLHSQHSTKAVVA